MNKNRYKLIFSKSKSCLVPVAECIKSAVGNGSSDNISEKDSESEEPPHFEQHPFSTVSLLIKTALNPVSSVMRLTWKQFSIVFLTVASVPVLADSTNSPSNLPSPADKVILKDINGKALLTAIDKTNNTNIELSEDNKNNTKIYQTENKVIVIDIAKPNDKHISDNRFNKFNITNGAVFNNNKDVAEKKSLLVGYIPKNKNLENGSEAKVILNQVTGSEISKIEGALEVLGGKADLVIANPNGLILNGVQTINSDRFVATTSKEINPSQMLLNVTNGTVTIDVDGFATDGLQYLDIIAKKIEQKEVIANKNKKSTQRANITFIAGQSEYNLTNHTLVESSKGKASSNEIAITGASTGAMHGQNIKLVVTDKGAGVKHDGIILSESDVRIELNDGDLDLGNAQKSTTVESDRTVRAKKKFEVTNSKRTTIGSEVDAKQIDVAAQETILRKDAKITARESASINSTKSITIEENAKLVSPKVNVTTETLKNDGRILGSDVVIDANDLVNQNEIYADKNLDIKTKGKEHYSVFSHDNHAVSLVKEVASLKTGFVNKGKIESNGTATLTFKDNTSYLTNGNKFVRAKDKLTINADGVEIDKTQNIQSTAHITINTNHSFVNRGTLASSKGINITSDKGNIYNDMGLLGSGETIQLTAKSGNIINHAGSLLHSEGNINLDANHLVYNLGEINTKKDVVVNASALVNDVQLTGKPIYKRLSKDRRYEMTTIADHGWHNNVYELELNLQELDRNEVKLDKLGAIRVGGNFTFNTKKPASPSDLDGQDLSGKLINHGLINVKGTFKTDADKIINEMKAQEINALDVFKNNADIAIYYQPLARFIWTSLSGKTHTRFNTLESFFDSLFGSNPVAITSLYASENWKAYQILRHVKHSPIFQKAMEHAFGSNWQAMSYQAMSAKWKEFKKNPTSFKYYPSEKARIFAGTFDASTKNIQNGELSEKGNFDSKLTIGKHSLTVPNADFRSEVNKEILELNKDGVDLSALSDLLDIPNLFIDNSVQLEKTTTEIDAEDQAILDKEPDYLNPNLLRQNKEFLDKLLIDLNEEKYVKDDAYYDARRTNNERFENLPRDLQRRLHEEFSRRKEEQNAKRLELLRKAKEEKEAKNQQRNDNYKVEEKRLENDKIIKQKELEAQANEEKLIKETEAKREVEIAEKERKQKEAEILAKEQEKIEQEKKEEELKALERQREEYRKLAEEHFKVEAEKSKKKFLKTIDDNRPKVETDPLYRTKLSYIKQDEYAGADYFFNKVASDTEGKKKVNVLGDNYFDHQLITRTIEKKADNQLEQKYNLSGVELVKKLMENSSLQAKELGLKLGAVLTQEQQANLTQDIVWYVKTNVKGKEVFVPQVYLAQKTTNDIEKLRGLGTGTIQARNLNIQAENVKNTGTLSGQQVNITASEKIQNRGSILSTEETRLIGRKGIENESRVFANDELGVTNQRSEIKTEGHLHLETDKDASVDVRASDIKAKSAYVKTGDLNLKDAHDTKHSYEEHFQGSAINVDFGSKNRNSSLGIGTSSKSENKSEATSVGSKLSTEQLHLAIEKDVNQVGSVIETKRIGGIVKGNYNTKAGENIKHAESEEYGSQVYFSGHASGGGTSVRYDYNSKDGGKGSANAPTTQTGLGVGIGMAFTHEKNKETLLTHTNSELQAESGKLHVLNTADIGGVDINTKLPEKVEPKGAQPKAVQPETNVNTNKSTTSDRKSSEAPNLGQLSDAEIEKLMAEKSKEDFKKDAEKPASSGFELSAKDIKSTKQKDQYDSESQRTSFKVGPEVEAHSAVADMVSNLVRQYRDAQNGIKTDGTAVLQHASDALNIITGDLAGTSLKVAVERNKETKTTKETGDIVTKLGGNVTLSARDGSIELKNIQSDENTNLALKAKENVNILAGEKTRETEETVSRQKLAHGVHAGCSLMSGACTAGVSTSIEGNQSYTSERALTHNNSVLKGQSIKVEAGKDLNLVSSNIDANNVDLNVEGKTNIISKQDTLDKKTHGFDFNLSAGVAVSSATIATPTGTIGGGYTNESESSRKVNKQAGIKANKLTGQIQDLNLEAGYIASKDKSDLNLKGNVTSKELRDKHDKDGGSFGLSVGISERGTTAFNIRGGRAEQKHYNATQKSTISGVNTTSGQVSGRVNKDLSKATDVTRNDTYASTQFSFEVADIVEVGQRAKNKLSTSKLNYTSDAGVPKSRSRTDGDDGQSGFVKNSIYESIDNLPQTPKARNAEAAEMVDNPLYGSVTPRTKSADTEGNVAKKHDYEEIPGSVYNKLGDDSSDIARNKAGKADEHIYEEINGTYSKLGDADANKGRVAPKAASDDTYSTVGDANANQGTGFKRAGNTDGIYSTVEAPSADVARKGSTVTTEYAELGQSGRRNANDPLPPVPGQGKAKTNVDTSEHIYDVIADNSSKAKRPLPATPDAQQPKASVNNGDGEYSTINAPKSRNVNDPLPELPGQSRAKRNLDSVDHIYDEINDSASKAKRALPATPNAKVKAADTSDVEYTTINTSSSKVKNVDNDGIYSEVADVTTVQPRSKSIKGESDYEAIPDSDLGEQPRSLSKRSSIAENNVESKVRSNSEENSAELGKAKVSDDLYAKLDKSEAGRAKANAKADEVAQNATAKVKVDNDEAPELPKRPSDLTSDTQSTNAKANRVLPEVPEKPQVRNRIVGDGDYAEITETAPKANPKAQRELPELPNVAKPRSDGDPDYAEIGPNAVGKAVRPQTETVAENVVAKIKPEELNSNNNSNKDTNAKSEVVNSDKAEKSFFRKVKDFFTGSSSKEKAKEKSKATKAQAEETANTKPNYDGLEDSVNLKNLLALEGKRNEAFETNVLKNAEFLAEAREAAKKYIPEATIKQMGNSPEFDDILTEGARKVEKRINDAVTFKPTVEEFTEIQGLVKQLPKGAVIEDVNVKTQSITEALAETSKTIQRNPKLKEEVQGAIEDFLKSSQGKDLTVEMIEKLNHGLRPDEGADRQLYKKETLTKENAVFSSPEASKIQLSETVDFINKARSQGVEPSVLAGLVYQRLIAYHPFAEGNGRMARVIVNKLLLDAGYPPFTKFNSEFETQIIPQTNTTAKSATSSEVVKEFLTELGKKPLPEVTEQPRVKATIEAEGDYSEIPAVTSPLKPRSTSTSAEGDYATIPANDVVDTPRPRSNSVSEESVDVSVKTKQVEDIYATVNKSPEALAKAKERGDAAAANNPVVKVKVEDDDVPPALPIRPELKDAAGINSKSKVKSEDAASSTEKTSLFGKIKQLFTGSESSKATKAQAEETANTKPNYDGLEDSVNLKNLLALEGKRNEAFETNVLKNAEFLAEAREAAKKYIPEATIKQMGNSPEFDDILTEGARKVEKRINDAVTFKPTVEEFTEIQGLVKQLPKGAVIEDVNVKTQSITEALAETSKTIQRNPKLKEEVQGAIEDFLKSSQGKDLTVEMIEKLNHGLRPDEGADRQLYKKETLTKENAVFSSPEASKIQLSETVDFINKARSQGVEPSVLAGLVYQRLIAYHPFAEGNGRMARVIVNKLLLDAGYPPFTKFNSEFETQIIPQTNTTAKSATSSEVVKEFLTELGKKGDAIQKPVAKPAEQNSVETNRTLDQVVGATAFRRANVETEQPKAAVPTAEVKAQVNKPVSERVQQKELVEKSRGVLKQVQDQFQPLKVKHKIDDVRSSVEQYGGEVTFKYAQSKGEVYKEIVKHAETEHGVCESTCAHWIANKVSNQGEDFWNTLYEGGKKGHLKQDAIDSIKKLQTEFMNSGSATQQFKLTDSWLQEQGVVPKEKKVGSSSRRDEVAGTVSKTDISALTKAILDTGSDSSGVKKISINLEGGSHTVSAAIQGQKVVFFDPNFGEMTFPSHKQFESWLKGAFWEKSGYAGKKEGKRFFNVVNYELPANADKPKTVTKPVVANEQDVQSKKHGLSNPFRSKGKDSAEGPKIEHLGGSADKDAFYFPLDKIVTKGSISKDMKVNLENIKKAFNPKDKHYNSPEAKSLRTMYEQDPTMSSTRFVIGNQVIENPFKSQDLQDYIQKNRTVEPVVKKAKQEKQAEVAAKKPVVPAKPKAQAETVADQNAIYAKVNKQAKSAQVDGFYSESELKTRSDKIVDQVSRVPNTDPVYADLQFSQVKGKSAHKASSEVVYDEVKTQTKAKPKAPKKAEKPAVAPRANQQLDSGIIPDSQLKTRSDKIVDHISRVPNTEPVYADLQFPEQGNAKKVTSSQETIYEEVGKKTQEEPIYQNVIRKTR
ncbi:YopT-type cysteine protease domain-containing protein [Pasteurella dagmatis]|nr:YopT-type cysteine protease domain-containing protein [Pasteurella dagmatis]SNV55429.1 protein PfhB2 [Pasteurella dagmatis]